MIRDILPPDAISYRRYRDRTDRDRRLAARILSVLTVGVGVFYLIWVTRVLNPERPLLIAAFIAAEIFALVLFLIMAVDVWLIRYKRVEGLPAPGNPSVDVFIPILNEPLPVIERTLRAASEIKWAGPLELYVLDDGSNSEVATLATSLGANYLSRPDNQDAKAGNLNFGLEHSDGDFILVLDADHVARPNIVQRLIGYMRFPKVAFVQSKQEFRTPPEDPMDADDEVFYEAVQLGFDADNTVISCGSGVLYRRAALEDVGGFATWNLVEDLTTSYELHAQGWKSFYYPYPLSVGSAPKDVWGVYQQRGQWGLDTMRLFLWDNPLFKKGLSWRKRLNYLVPPLMYLFSGFVLPLFFSFPILNHFFGISVLTGAEPLYGLIRLIYLILMVQAIAHLLRHRPAGKQFQVLAGIFPVYALATLRAFIFPPGHKPSYQSNPAVGSPRDWPTFIAVIPQLCILLANLIGPFYALVYDTTSIGSWLVNTAISLFAVWTMARISLAGVLNPGTQAAKRGK